MGKQDEPKVTLTYAVDGMQRLTRGDSGSGYLRDLVIVARASVLALGLGAATLQRRSA